ncbi:hypothetical protein BO443_60139 [Burkholderia orbicola]
MRTGAGPARRRARSRTPTREPDARYSSFTRVAGIEVVEYRAALGVRGKTAPTIARLPTNVIGTRAPRRRFYRTDSAFESIFTHAALRYRAPGDASPRSPPG